MKNIKLTIGYDGTDFCGWQMNGKDPSVEEELKKAVEQILQEKITLQAASRTDAGVHAEGQVVNFFTSNENLTLTCISHKHSSRFGQTVLPDDKERPEGRVKLTLPSGYLKSDGETDGQSGRTVCEKCGLSQLTKGLNALLPKTIVVFSAQEMHPDFHTSLHVLKKTYIYNICFGKVQLPHLRKYSWHMPYTLQKEEIERAKGYFLGKQDFSAFCNGHPNQRYTTKEREIFSIQIHPLSDNRMQFEITGDHFLYKMVRNIVGTLIYVGAGKLQAEEIPSILATKSRPQAAITAPAHGLSLKEIFYSQSLTDS